MNEKGQIGIYINNHNDTAYVSKMTFKNIYVGNTIHIYRLYIGIYIVYIWYMIYGGR